MWQAVVTDLDQHARQFIADYDEIKITARLNGYRDVQINVAPNDPSSPDLLIAQRALKVYSATGAPRFNGQIWEPLERTSGGIKVVARDPYATFAWRRVRASTSYTATNNAGGPWDAGQIFADRIAVQNSYRNTYLRAGARQASANRVRKYDPGMLEHDLITNLANVANGYFFLIDPLDGVAGSMAEARVLYPNAGSTREEVRFEFGEGTLDNCSDYSTVQTLPRNRYVTSGAGDDGTGFSGRIAASAEDATSIATFGLFEDEDAFSDVSELATLQEHADASLALAPPTAVTLTPSADAPVLFRDFDVGDFVRAKIVDGSYLFYGWVRVLEATLTVDNNGDETTSAITLELLVGGGAATAHPEDLLRDLLDRFRRNIESLTRKVEAEAGNEAAPPAPPAPDPGTSETPPPDVTPPAPPPPAPSAPPTIANFSAIGITTSQIQVEADVDGAGQPTTVTVQVFRAGPTLVTTTDPASVGAGGHFSRFISSLSRSTSYDVTIYAENASGITSMTMTTSTLNVDP